MHALSAIPIALLALLSASSIPAVRAGYQCALIPPKGYTKSSTGGTPDHNGGGTAPGAPAGPSGNTTSPSPSGNGTTAAECVTQKVSAAWYTGWHAAQFPPSAIAWDKYSLVTYSFATTTGQDDPLSVSDADAQILPEFVRTAHANNCKASLSLGGWGGSEYFSSSVATQSNRTDLVNAILGLVSKYDLDGIDFDWEFPTEAGAGNVATPADTTHFLLLLEEIRATKPGKELVLSAAVSVAPFDGPDGNPLADVSAFAAVLDFIEIMVYDIFGTDDPRGVGPNAPLNDTCASSSMRAGSAVSAVAAWTGAAFPARQIALGVASYGHSYNITPTSAGAFNASGVDYAQAAACGVFDARVQSNFTWDGTEGEDRCGNPLPSGGVWNFNAMVGGGYLGTDGKAASGVEYRLDACSQTPYVYSPATHELISYDDAASFAAKGDFIRDQGLLGFAMWELAADYDDILLTAISDAMKCPD